MTQAPGLSLLRSLKALPLYLAFIGTGVGVALPGAILPALLIRWHLGDEQAGRLFLAAWIGSSVGALLVRRALRTHLLMGSLAVSLAAVAIGLTQGRGADLALALFGFGLGSIMTSISLIREQQSRRGGDPREAGTEMVRLNLFWALGAFACPMLALHALAVGAVRPLLFGVALAFAAMAAWTASQTNLPVGPAAVAMSSKGLFRTTPAGLIAMTFLVTGIEASAGSWLATLAHRGEHTLAATVAAPTLFWAGLLISRAFWSAFPRWLAHGKVVRANAALMAVCSTLLVVAHKEGASLAAACLLGFGIGPVYPLLLAWALRFHRGGPIFFLAGVGSGLLPWLTGLVSAHSHSLRAGFSVPMLGTLLLLALALFLPLSNWSRMEEHAKI